jgi:hypothetical protein
MPQPFTDRLRSYFIKVGEVLRGEAAAASIFPNSTDVGIARERVYAEFLKHHLPQGCHVAFGGFLFGQDGSESGQIDIIVTSDSALQYKFFNRDGGGKFFTCVDGTLAVVCLKSTLDSKELHDALRNISSIPDKLPIGERVPPSLNLREADYNDWPFKIIYASNGISEAALTNTLLDFYKDNPEIPHSRQPNLIHVAGKYSLLRVFTDAPKSDGTLWPANTYHPHADATDVYPLSYAVTRIQEISAGERFLIQTYGQILNRIQTAPKKELRWVRIK